MLRSSKYSSSRWPSLKLPLVRADLSMFPAFIPASPILFRLGPGWG